MPKDEVLVLKVWIVVAAGRRRCVMGVVGGNIGRDKVSDRRLST